MGQTVSPAAHCTSTQVTTTTVHSFAECVCACLTGRAIVKVCGADGSGGVVGFGSFGWRMRVHDLACTARLYFAAGLADLSLLRPAQASPIPTLTRDARHARTTHAHHTRADMASSYDRAITVFSPGTRARAS